MPNKPAAAKALRQTKKHTARNRAIQAKLEIALKQARRAITAQAKEAGVNVKAAIKSLDRAYQKGVIKKNTAARKKSRLMKALHAIAKK